MRAEAKALNPLGEFRLFRRDLWAFYAMSQEKPFRDSSSKIMQEEHSASRRWTEKRKAGGLESR